MQHYELLCIIPIKYSDEEAAKVVKTIAGMITAGGGKITREDSLGKLRLAYPIKHVYQGHYPLMEFDLEGEEVKKMERELRLMPEILRYEMVKKVAGSEERLKQAILKEKKEKLEQQREEQKTPTKPEEKKEEPRKKIDLEELEKKLDKILDTDII
ncbi:MAG: 30S ribosomal protein S6 [Patescibacteria group bacterium]|nr:30S ribosomal protein S6 [Patescibacteria group bacterium]MDD5490915.1 30S ribosomal protein S6 [Patescibacteria group bacterium]